MTFLRLKMRGVANRVIAIDLMLIKGQVPTETWLTRPLVRSTS